MLEIPYARDTYNNEQKRANFFPYEIYLLISS